MKETLKHRWELIGGIAIVFIMFFGCIYFLSSCSGGGSSPVDIVKEKPKPAPDPEPTPAPDPEPESVPLIPLEPSTPIEKPNPNPNPNPTPEPNPNPTPEPTPSKPLEPPVKIIDWIDLKPSTPIEEPEPPVESPFPDWFPLMKRYNLRDNENNGNDWLSIADDTIYSRRFMNGASKEIPFNEIVVEVIDGHNHILTIEYTVKGHKMMVNYGNGSNVMIKYKMKGDSSWDGWKRYNNEILKP